LQEKSHAARKKMFSLYQLRVTIALVSEMISVGGIKIQSKPSNNEGIDQLQKDSFYFFPY